MARVAITRGISRNLDRCELTHLEQEPIDLARARAQHREYEAALARLGCRVVSLEGEPEMPDCVFVEDTAVVLDEVAVLTRPGAPSRRPETPAVRAALGAYRPTVEIEAPATLDGGDVLAAGRTLFVGLSSRTGREAIEQLARLVEEHGYRVVAVELDGCLHLKSAVTEAATGTLLVQPRWVDRASFDGWELIEVDPSEPHAANVLRIGDTVLCASGHPRTAERLRNHGLKVVAVDQSELAKAEGGLTCCSLIFEERSEA